MFTGIVEEIGIITKLKKENNQIEVSIKSKRVLENTKIGDSICTNGVCLTVTNLGSNYFSAYIMPETFKMTAFKNLKEGLSVNLERALTLNTPLGGHMVSGHVDGKGKIIDIKKDEKSVWIGIKASRDILKYIIYKGSVAIDGISLTVAYVDENMFKVSIIPQTGKETTLLSKNLGDEVNLETDIVGKYIEKLLRFKNYSKESDSNKSNISEDFLRVNGFI